MQIFSGPLRGISYLRKCLTIWISVVNAALLDANMLREMTRHTKSTLPVFLAVVRR